MTEPKTTQYIVNEEGVLEVKNFKARTFGEALVGVLDKGWDKKPTVLAKACVKSPDILTIIIGIMNSFAEYLWTHRAKVEAKIEKRTAALEKSCKKETFDAEVVRQDNTLKLLYKDLAFYDERLWALEEKTPCEWLSKIGKVEFTAIVEGLKEFLETEVTEAWCAFIPALDTAQGKAVEDMRQLSADMMDALDLRFLANDGISLPLAVSTTLTATEANKVAKAANLPIKFVKVRQR